MRFNATELLHLAHQPSVYYDKEGVLFLKEKQDGIFRKSKAEVYVERLFRLRGNLLFYFKTKDPSSEVLGIFILERCVVQLDEDEDDFYSLSIYFDGDEKEKIIRLSSHDESDRDSWIGHIHIASYECLKIQMESLRDRLLERTGADPLQDQLLSADNCMGITRVSNDETFVEMSIACSSLPGEANGQPPDTFASVHYQTSSSSGRWIQSAHTEIVEKQADPTYLSTVSFGRSITTDTTAKVKVKIHSVKERMTNAMTQLGAVEFLMSDVLPMFGQPVTFSISSTGGVSKVFTLVLLMWYRDGPLQKLSSALSSSSQQVVPSNGQQVKSDSITAYQYKRDVDLLKCFYAAVLTKTFSLKSSIPSDQLIVHEYMGESRLTYILPKLLLKLLIDEERSRIDQLQDLGSLGKDWDAVRKEVIDFYLSTVASYEQHVRYLSSLSGTYLKASAKKSHKEVEFVPTNLHIQRMVAYTTSTTTAKTYDVITVGAFMAGAQKFKHGGLRRLLSRLDSEQAARTSEGSTNERLSTLANILSSLPQLNSATMSCCDSVCSAAVDGNSRDILKATAELVCQTRDLIKACEHPLVHAGICSYSSVQARSVAEAVANQRDSLFNGATPTRSDSPALDKNWKWNGTDIVNSPTDEPWELTRSNSEAALICVQSKVDALVEEPMEHAVKWLDKLSPLIIKLKRCVEVMCSRARSGLIFVFIQECGENLPLIHSIRYRRDVILSQALTAATSGFVTKFYRFMEDKSFMAQLSHIGVLLEFEGLLSCYGEDVGMLEDMAVGVEDLAKVVFRLEKVSVPRLDFSKLSPTVSGDRCHITVSLPVDEEMYNQLPQEIKQNGIKVVPVMFNIGINEQATMAEKFGSTSLQESINVENYRKLSQYYQSYLLCQESEGSGCSDAQTLTLESLMRNLHVQIMSKKNKNVEVLHLASAVCLTLNGVRFTSCKSAKDRTAMAVTLEQAQLLQKENSLDPETFLRTLECMRSQGVRRENTYKNTGFRKYAFNSIQVLALPKLYRPPAGTYGNYDT